MLDAVEMPVSLTTDRYLGGENCRVKIKRWIQLSH